MEETDAAQLPPINTEGDEDSPAFTLFDNVVELTERFRQSSDNPILELSDIIREEIKGDHNIGRVIEEIQNAKIVDGKGFMPLRLRDFLSHYKNITDDYMQAKVIAYRNATVNKFNLTIRSYIHNKPDAPFIPGEIIYMNDTYFCDKDPAEIQTIGDFENNKSPGKKYFCYNSDEYKINFVEKGKQEGIDIYKIYIDTEGNSDFKGIENVFIPVVSPKGVPEYSKIFYHRKSKALNAPYDKRKSLWKYFFDFKNSFADCSYAYAMTGHKAQGSGYRYIYVDVNDILTVGPISAKRKLQALYTAMTRATDLVMFLKSN